MWQQNAKVYALTENDSSIFNSPYTVGAAVGVAGAFTCFALCHGDDPISPSSPKP